jgi:hypothetical protein
MSRGLLAAFCSLHRGRSPVAVCCANHCRRAPAVQLHAQTRGLSGGGGFR